MTMWFDAAMRFAHAPSALVRWLMKSLNLSADVAKVDEVSVLTLTAKVLQESFRSSRLSHVDAMLMYLDQIERHNHQGMRLHAVIQIAPQEMLERRAKQLEEEREHGNDRGPLHGIPVLIKDNICTPSLSMNTTLGSYAFKGCRGVRDGIVVERLQKAGAVIIGKTNMSELGNMKGERLMGGWSALGGQTQSPYIEGGVTPDALWLGETTPMGSSSGSAVGVAAGFSPLSVGTETDGSVIQPAARASLYALKVTPGRIPLTGMQRAVPSHDSPGGFAKSAADLANLISVMVDDADLATASDSGEWSELGLGVVDPETWRLPDWILEPIELVKTESFLAFKKACASIRVAGGRVSDAPLTFLDDMWDEYGVVPQSKLMTHELRAAFESFMQEDLVDGPVKTLEELMQFNEDHADVELPPVRGKDNQKGLEAAASDTMTDSEHSRELPRTRQAVQKALFKALADADNADVLISLSDSFFPNVAAMAGWPTANVPLGSTTYNGRPFGAYLIAPAGKERLLLRVMGAWERSFPEARKVPPLLERYEDVSEKVVSRSQL